MRFLCTEMKRKFLSSNEKHREYRMYLVKKYATLAKKAWRTVE